MNAYIYKAALYCESCGEEICKGLEKPSSEIFDSNEYPKGPHTDGGGDTDVPVHCEKCGVYLEAVLTADGRRYVLDKIKDYLESGMGAPKVLDEWAADLCGRYLLAPKDLKIMEAYTILRRKEKENALDGERFDGLS